LLCEAEEIKYTLTSRKTAEVRLLFSGLSLQTRLTRADFDDLTAHLLDRTRFTINKLVNDSGTSWIEVDRILLIGGSTRMLQVREMLLKETGIEPDASISADEAVAHGAAIYASTFKAKAAPPPISSPSVAPEQADEANKLHVTDVNAHNLGVLGTDRKTGLRVNHIMIPRNTPLPASRTSRMETVRANQPNVVVEVVEGGDESGQHATPIGRCVIDGLPPHLKAGTPVDVSFHYDTDGLIHVEAVLPATGQKTSLTIHRTAGMTDEVRDQMHDILAELGLDD
jgi:molecular chaperone DnaK